MTIAEEVIAAIDKGDESSIERLCGSITSVFEDYANQQTVARFCDGSELLYNGIASKEDGSAVELKQ